MWNATPQHILAGRLNHTVFLVVGSLKNRNPSECEPVICVANVLSRAYRTHAPVKFESFSQETS